MIRARLILMIICVLFAGGSVFGADDEAEKIRELESKIRQLEQQIEAIKSEKDSEQLLEIRRQLGVLAEELEKLRSGEKEVELSEQTRRSLGLGPSAARVYTKEHGVSIAGYGEMLYENFDDETDSGTISGRFDQLDYLRAVVYFGYRFNNRILFNSEIEFEHASTGAGGEASVEFANIDYILNDFLTLRGGLVLVPMGFVNEFHEPNVFLGARRPVTETVIIPTTWRENGAGIVGRKGIFDYRAYVVAPFNSAGFSSTGLRGGRQQGARSRIESPAIVGRMDVYPYAGLLLGGSIYTGDSGFFRETFTPGLEFSTTIGEAHAEYRYGPWELRALYARASVDNVAELNAALELGTASIGESLGGGYLQAGYSMSVGNEVSLTPYIRYEKVDTQREVPAGFLRNAATRQSLWTFGAELRPINNLVIKADYQAMDNDANSAIDQFNIVLGYAF